MKSQGNGYVWPNPAIDYLGRRVGLSICYLQNRGHFQCLQFPRPNNRFRPFHPQKSNASTRERFAEIHVAGLEHLLSLSIPYRLSLS